MYFSHRKIPIFSGLLNSQFVKPEDGIYFVAREPSVFEYVLEFLIYGQLISNISDQSMLKKLSLDADFFLLPKLKEQVDLLLKEEKKTSENVIFAKLDNATLIASGQHWQWNGSRSLPPDYFSLSTQIQPNDTLTVKQEGTYLVLVRTTMNNSGNSVYLALRVNGVEVARSYNCHNTNYSASTSINEVFQFKAGDRLQISQTPNISSFNGPLNKNFSVILLG
jgi:hypothetical protein